MTRCATCKHWEQITYRRGRGHCHGIESDDDQGVATVQTVQGGAWFETSPEFGCSLHEPAHTVPSKALCDMVTRHVERDEAAFESVQTIYMTEEELLEKQAQLAAEFGMTVDELRQAVRDEVDGVAGTIGAAKFHQYDFLLGR